MLRNEVSLTPPGTRVTLSIIRNGAKQDISVKIGNLQTEQTAIETTLKQEFGLEVRPMTASEANSYGLNTQVGVTIVDISYNSPFGRAGFQKHDVILQIDNNQVDSAATLLTILRTLKGRSISVLAVDHNSGQSTMVQMNLR